MKSLLRSARTRRPGWPGTLSCLLTIVSLCSVAGCAGDRGKPARKSLQVLAATSLTDALDDLARAFEVTHPEVEVRRQYGASSVLRAQIEQGAGADVFAAADATNPEALAARGLAETPVVFARNRLTLIVPEANPGLVQSPRDLDKPGLRLVTTPESVPLGRYTRELLGRIEHLDGYPADYRARVLRNVASEDANARTVRSRIELGAADAAFVYETDAARAEGVRVIPLPEAVNVAVEYQVTLLASSRNQQTAREFVAFLQSEAGQSILRQYGFRQ